MCRFVALGIVFVGLLAEQGLTDDSAWWDRQWPCRIPIRVASAGFQRRDRPVEVTLDLALGPGTTTRAIERTALRLVEVTAGGAVQEADVPFQFDPTEDGGGSPRLAGILTFVLKGVSAGDAVRCYHLYFGHPTAAAAEFDRQVSLEESVPHQGQESYRVVTPSATYYYHQLGCGFASMIDRNGRDWISYNPGVGAKSKSGSGGQFRGIPNLGHPEGYCHPGMTVSNSRVAARGPLRASILSESNDGKMRCRWDIFPHHARMTLLTMGMPYWFLYEGTPGGQLDLDTDICVRPDGDRLLRTKAGERWDGDIVPSGEPGEWIYFVDGRRALFLIQHQDDEAHDSYWPMNEEMTVFGFGRKGLQKFLDRVPAEFTIGLCEGAGDEQILQTIRSAYIPLKIELGTIQRLR